MTNEEKRRQVVDFFGNPPEIDIDFRREIAEAAHTFCELGLLVDGLDSISTEQVIQCFHIVDTLRLKSFPDDLRM